jgi:hypothetical protein
MDENLPDNVIDFIPAYIRKLVFDCRDAAKEGLDMRSEIALLLTISERYKTGLVMIEFVNGWPQVIELETGEVWGFID